MEKEEENDDPQLPHFQPIFVKFTIKKTSERKFR